jgi:hypothetical protein
MLLLRSLLLALGLTLALICGACTPEDPFYPTLPPVSHAAAFVRIIHAASEAPPAVVYVGDAPFFGGTPQQYLYFSTGVNEAKYYPIDTSLKTISFRANGGSLATASIDLKKGLFYTAYLYGSPNNYHVLLTNDTVAPPPDASHTLVRVVHLSPDAGDLDVKLGDVQSTAPTIISCLQFGHASSYILQPANTTFGKGTGLYVDDCSTKDFIFGVPPPYVLMPGATIATIVLTGNKQPSGNQTFLSTSAFIESRLNADSLYGGLPLQLAFTAIRFANLIAAAADDPANPQLIDISFLDSTAKDWAPNDYFRRNLTGQENVRSVAPLGNANDFVRGLQPIRGYFQLGMIYKTWWPYRVEKNTVENSQWHADPQPVLVGKQTYLWQSGKRFTIVAYGPLNKDSAHSKVLYDNTPAPVSASNIRFRFFHGGYKLADKLLRIRIGTSTSKAMAYGDVPVGEESVEGPASADKIELLDESGTVIHLEPMSAGYLVGGKAYTIFLSEGAFGTYPVLTAVSDDFRSH